ncbi:MAG: hypothetical protein ACI9SY_000578 [Candidatus Paceibacteria bacterium]|jgi:hypothetical protein
MQAIPVIAGILLLGLVTLSGFQVVPESDPDGGSNSLNGGGVQIDTDTIGRAPTGELFSGSVTQTDPVITAVTIKSSQDIEQNTATLRGRIVVGPEEIGSAFFVYGTRQSDVVRLTDQENSYDDVQINTQTTVQTKRVSSSVRRSGDVSTRVGGLAVDTDYYVQLCVEVEARLKCSVVTDFESLDGSTRTSGIRIPTIRVSDDLVSGEAISLSIDVNMRDMEDGRVYVVYGESRTEVTEAVEEEYNNIDENDERLQAKRLATRVIGTREIIATIDDLDDETEHYYAVCVSYDGRRDGFVCTRIDSFTTPDDSFGEAPRVTTRSVSVSGTTVALEGVINMRSFRNGQAFFVYGTDENTIEAVEGQRQMTSIRQNSDRLQRVLVDSDVDQSNSFRVVVGDLLFSTTYVTRLCVEFENEDERGRDRLYVECGDVREFATS